MRVIDQDRKRLPGGNGLQASRHMDAAGNSGSDGLLWYTEGMRYGCRGKNVIEVRVADERS